MRHALLALAVCGASPQAPSPPQDPSPPNVLFLLADDLAQSAIHALGNPEVRTPAMDSLVARGTALTRVYNMGSWAAAVCLPARSMLLSGRSLWRTDGELKAPTLPEILRNHGYTTFFAGKWHNPPAALQRAFSHGGHVFFGAMADHLAIPVHRFRPDGRYRRYGRRGPRFSTELFATDAIEFLESYEGDGPFFALVSFTAPHDPFQAPPPYSDLYRPEELTLPRGFLPRPPFDNGDLFVRDERLLPYPRTPGALRRHLAGYYAMVSHLDHWIGRVLEALERSGKVDNTVVLLASDHGLCLGRHGLLGKQNLYEASLLVPVVLVGPNIPADRRVDVLAYTFDLMPTVLELAGIPPPEGVEGRSLLKALRASSAVVRSTIHGAYLDVQRSIRDERYKLIRYTVGERVVEELFDLSRDPEELRNLADADGRSEVLGTLRAELEKARKSFGDPTLR